MSILDPDLVIEKAHQLVRSDDLLGRAWDAPFRALVDAVATEARLRPLRIDRFVAELLRARPDAAETPLPAPVVITRLPPPAPTMPACPVPRVMRDGGYRLWG